MLEAITLIGAIVGLATGVFTVWDRWVRGRPLAWLTVTIRTGGTPADPGIRIKNPGPTDLLIQGVRPHPADIYGVAKDHSIKATMTALDADVNLLLRPGQEHSWQSSIDALLPRRRTRHSGSASLSIGARPAPLGCRRFPS